MNTFHLFFQNKEHTLKINDKITAFQKKNNLQEYFKIVWNNFINFICRNYKCSLKSTVKKLEKFSAYLKK